MQAGPISVSAPGMSLIGASADQITFSTRYPFHKLDSTNDNSFEVITLFFNTEPPNPASPGTGLVTTSRTLVYSFPHGYTYTPSTWFLISLDSFETTVGAEGAFILNPGFGQSTAQLNIEVDETNVKFYIDKTWPNIFSLPPPPDIIGYFVSIRSYVFVEGLDATSVPSQA